MVKKNPMHVEPENPDEGPIAPVTVGNPLSAADLAIDQSHMEDFMSVEEGPAEVTCAKPPKGTFFAVYQEDRHDLAEPSLLFHDGSAGPRSLSGSRPSSPSRRRRKARTPFARC